MPCRFVVWLAVPTHNRSSWQKQKTMCLAYEHLEIDCVILKIDQNETKIDTISPCLSVYYTSYFNIFIAYGSLQLQVNIFFSFMLRPDDILTEETDFGMLLV